MLTPLLIISFLIIFGNFFHISLSRNSGADPIPIKPLICFSKYLNRFREIHERALDSQVEQGPLVPVDAQLEVEEDDWVYQTVDEETLRDLSHRVVLQTSAGKRKVLFETKNLDEAMDCATRIVEFSDGCVLVETIDP